MLEKEMNKHLIYSFTYFRLFSYLFNQFVYNYNSFFLFLNYSNYFYIHHICNLITSLTHVNKHNFLIFPTRIHLFFIQNIVRTFLESLLYIYPLHPSLVSFPVSIPCVIPCIYPLYPPIAEIFLT